ncbi:MAG: thiamine phosphate synthase [Muribaculaceae bacterium]|nr:thiamine phosphate synthase [Muribaculaceae bacterium]
MELIAITVPYFYANESREIGRLLSEKRFSRLHIRKPGATAEEMRRLLAEIPAELRSRVSLHDCHELAEEFGVGGVHLSRRNTMPPAGWRGLVSRSLHLVEDIREVNEDYVFLSPIFPSISKPGYKGHFNIEELKDVVNKKVFALGGITEERLPIVERIGFGGAAMLGAVWHRRIDPEQFKLQLITNGVGVDDTVAGAAEAMKGGCRWVQIRMKDAPVEDVERVVEMVAPMCRNSGAILLVDDHVELAAHVDCIDGVHVGKNDMPVAEARKLLGPSKILGATANTFEDVEKAVAAGADYVGLGPFRFTTTKKKLSPVLGIEGYADILNKCRERGFNVPIVAIGGITLQDIPGIAQTGVSGVAVSGTILKAENPSEMTARIVEAINHSLIKK